MKKTIVTGILFLNILGLAIAYGQSKSKQKAITNKVEKVKDSLLVLKSAHHGPVVNAIHPDVIASKNKSGFETGQVVTINGIYHMFVNEMFDRPHRDLRISYWTSTDAINWKRHSTILESIPGRTPANPRSEVWVNGVVFNKEEDAWNIFYTAYRSGDSAKGEIHANDYAGRIWRAKSVKTGIDGIAGPYADMDVILQPDYNTQSWEGDQAVASFNPYQVGDTWYAMYDGHNHKPISGWPTGMAYAGKLSGPWTRMPEGFNPIPVVDHFMENAIVSRLKDGRYMMVFDSFGDYEIGYSISNDGINWGKEVRVKIFTKDDEWAEKGDHHTRTPLCAIEENDGTFTVIYTAMYLENDKKFYALGKCSLGWVVNE